MPAFTAAAAYILAACSDRRKRLTGAGLAVCSVLAVCSRSAACCTAQPLPFLHRPTALPPAAFPLQPAASGEAYEVDQPEQVGICVSVLHLPPGALVQAAYIRTTFACEGFHATGACLPGLLPRREGGFVAARCERVALP